MSPSKFTQDKRVFVLDGGLATQILHHIDTNVDGDPLWTARLLQTNPDDILKTHLDFIRAGADVISTATYQASIGGFMKHLNVDAEGAYALIRRAVELSKRARDIYIEECKEKGIPHRSILVAGSVGPYGAHLNDGSEYTGSYADSTSEETMFQWHKPRIDTLVSSGVDLLAIETIPSEKEALMLVNIIKEYPHIKAWISLNCKDNQSLAHGENFQSVARACWEANRDQLVAIGINCVAPTFVENLITGISKDITPPIPIVTYPNSGEKYNAGVGWVENEKCDSLYVFVKRWLDLNVRFVGGCCRTDAGDIANIRKEVDSWSAKN